MKDIAIASTAALLHNVMDNSIYRMWLMAQLYDMHTNLAWIPDEAEGMDPRLQSLVP